MKRALHAALLGMCMLSAQAAYMGTARECARPGLATRHKNGNGGEFTWDTQAGPTGPDAPAAHKIALWGDSLTSARDFADTVLNAYGIDKATVLPSFIQAGFTVPWLSVPLKAGCASSGWHVAYAHKEKRSLSGFSKGFLSMSSGTPGDAVFLDFRFPLASTRVRQLDILYEKPRPDGSLLLGVAVDGGDENFISLSKKSGTILQIKPETPMATIRIRLVSGQITVHGFEPVYRDAPAVVLDSLSVPGGLLRSWSNADERHFPAGPKPAAGYSLILVQYGTNEGASPGFNREKYADYLRINLSRMRKFYPVSRCILIGPPDRGVAAGAPGSGALKYSAVHHQIALAQRQVGLEYRCGFWDWQAAMGGPGAAALWEKMTPPQMQRDLTHLTSRGYEASARMFAAAFPLDPH